MASAKQDFERFIVWLHQAGKEIPSNVRRLANLALANFDELARTSSSRSQRTIYLTGLMRATLAQTSDEAPEAQAAAANGDWPWKRLRNLTLGPFRGFRTPEPFDLQKRIILFYGPNGSGKTSFCEALEYALLGVVEEAENKRIDPRVYLANIHEGRFAPPTLTATDHQDREINVLVNSEAFRFCFVEKNRIDAFSRIAARPAGQRSELIATLFGMDQFSDFVGNFNESMDRQLVLEPKTADILAARREGLANDQATVDGDKGALEGLDKENTELARSHSADITYAGLKALIGSEDAPGRLQELEDILNAVPPAAIGLTREGLSAACQAAQERHEQVNGIETALSKRSAQVSFMDLYNSVLALQETEGDHCPACDTPLLGPVHVVTNPYEKARAGLDDLKDLAELQDSLTVAEAAFGTASRALRHQLTVLNGFVTAHHEDETAVGRYLAGLADEPLGAWWTTRQPEEPLAPESVTLEQLLAVADRVATQDAAAAQAQQERQRNIEERDGLNAFRLKVQAQDLKRQQHVDNVAAARDRIAKFDEANANLSKQVAQEKQDIERDAPIKAAYDRFLTEIREYREQLPGGLMGGLNETAMILYNEFNRNDLDADKLAELHLPLTGDDKIEIVFRGRPGVRVDALHVLSEGHIRCLGLAILLAKAKSIGSPLVVFDDAINAIDHDHRAGIREAIFENDNFLDMQLIVTCHSNEFIKDIQQHLPQRQREQCTEILFRHHTGDYQPRITRKVPNGNYIAQARTAKDLLNDRGALAASRQALEMLTAKTWGWLASHDLGLLSLQLAGVGKEPALRNVCDAILKKLRQAGTFNHASKDRLVAAYERILGIPEANLVWTYLNKGTHEEADRDDFDGEVVETVIQTLQELDAIDLRHGR
ncbi:AAA family ATPase [Sinorhizobium medicae]|uniref:DNA replication and repair protein RecF n=1 Tax=Sinorhizobium medicae TaxID=110321 RepID=A0A508WRA1_9HYPH|nr:AAA family ATPase [Sinorhizobium medicae]MDX0524828.1 AAA family ATPase [Sinorhizobium medicae]VTZ59307.1 DNA replication and repair protein RecF [Sinorhizobium medicae]